MDRLLDDEEIKRIIPMETQNTKWCPQHGYPLPCDKCGMGIREQTLRVVGEWLEEYHEYPHNASGEPVVTMRRANCPECLWQLKQGKMPEGE